MPIVLHEHDKVSEPLCPANPRVQPLLISTLEERLAQQISNELAAYATENTSTEREESILDIVQWGSRVRDMIERHPAQWRFGNWENGTRFPAVWRGQHLVRPEE
jgi:hypothetical protein